MYFAKALVGTLAVIAISSPALAEWRWVEEETVESGTYADEERQAPSYYAQQPRPVYRETPVVVTDRQVFRDGNCEVTRTFLSDGSTNDERLCTRTRLLLPHEFIIDRIGRHFDRLRGYDRGHERGSPF